jgi:signal transduction histidine kinase
VLLLARADHVDFLRRAPVALDELTADVSAKAERLGARRWRVDEVAAAEIDADRERLCIAMLNLVCNAFEHTEPGAEIGIGSALRNGEAHLWVRDDGPGVAPADESRIFEPFARGTDPRRRSSGAGLGLALARAIAAAHGGCVRLDNRPGEGATFTLVVPVAGGLR